MIAPTLDLLFWNIFLPSNPSKTACIFPDKKESQKPLNTVCIVPSVRDPNWETMIKTNLSKQPDMALGAGLAGQVQTVELGKPNIGLTRRHHFHPTLDSP